MQLNVHGLDGLNQHVVSWQVKLRLASCCTRAALDWVVLLYGWAADGGEVCMPAPRWKFKTWLWWWRCTMFTVHSSGLVMLTRHQGVAGQARPAGNRTAKAFNARFFF
jgi:hypothetical protein